MMKLKNQKNVDYPHQLQIKLSNDTKQLSSTDSQNSINAIKHNLISG